MSSSEDEKVDTENEGCCCVSHAFLASAKRNLHNNAVVHVARTPTSSSSGADVVRRAIITDQGRVYEGDMAFTYAEVLSAIDLLSARLRSSCVASSDCNGGDKPKVVGVYMPPSVEYVVSVLAILRCGEAFLPLDPWWPKDRVSSIIASSGTDLIITSKSLFAQVSCGEMYCFEWILQSSKCDLVCFSMEDIVDGEESCENLECKMEWPCEMGVQRAFCYLMYTSGSTGQSKGVCGTEQGLLNRFLWMQKLFPLSTDDVLLFKTSISFVDHLQEFLGAMLSGCSLVIPPFHGLKEYPLTLVAVLQDYLVSRVTMVPSVMKSILPAIRTEAMVMIKSCLKLLVLSGEVFSVSLWNTLFKLLPKTSIVNLYGSTEVSGDCTYFDCKTLPSILEKEAVSSVPIGVPISNCFVALACEPDKPDVGEVVVSGLCLSCGYWMDSSVVPFEQNKTDTNFLYPCSENMSSETIFYKTGDFARRLCSGDLVFLGRKDRIIKVNGQRVALEEIEYTLRGHSDVDDAAVVSYGQSGERIYIKAFLILKEREKCGDIFRSSIRSWIVQKVPLAMVPNQFVIVDSFPVTFSGKVNYTLLARSDSYCKSVGREKINKISPDLLEAIKEAFCDALETNELFDDDDFFVQGGNSIAAAHAAFNLKINVKMIYDFSTPSKLYSAFLHGKYPANLIDSDPNVMPREDMRKGSLSNYLGLYDDRYSNSNNSPCYESFQKNEDQNILCKRFKVNIDHYGGLGTLKFCDFSWMSLVSQSCSFSRGNKIMYEKGHLDLNPVMLPSSRFKNENQSMKELWKIHMGSCVDASPLIVIKERDIFLFIGSHSQKFICSYAKSGVVKWEISLDGRIECSAAVLGDYSQVVVGCYMGKLYFLDFESGKLCWMFQTSGEVKCQPVVDNSRHIVWCGSHDHILYALDYRNCCCLHKLDCGGSVFGSPVIDGERDVLFVGSTSGRVTALLLKDCLFNTLWKRELKVPIFGSLSVSSPLGNVICCLVDGNIVALNNDGAMIWKNRVDGPIFSGPCSTFLLPFQVLICSRGGSVYSFDMENGCFLWKYHVGDPITSSAYVNEHLLLSYDMSLSPERLICVCSSTGKIHIHSLRFNDTNETNQNPTFSIKKFANWVLPGDSFSSPVMVGNKLFVGCRDDYVYCFEVSINSLPE